MLFDLFFFFKQKTAYEMRISDWSSDVCSSDLKVIIQLYPMFPADGEEGRKAARPLGNDSDMYQRIVHEWTDIVKAADEMGVWGIGTIEHHFQDRKSVV